MTKNKKEQINQTKPTRRSFLNILWALLGGVALVEFVAVAFAFLRPRKMQQQRAELKTIIEAGPAESFPVNSVTAFVRGKFYLARLKSMASIHVRLLS